VPEIQQVFDQVLLRLLGEINADALPSQARFELERAISAASQPTTTVPCHAGVVSAARRHPEENARSTAAQSFA
jgi:hypothetical protein